MNIFNIFRKQGKKATTDDGKPIGAVTHYYDKIGVAVLKLDAPLAVGDTVRFRGRNDFTQTVTSMQIDHAPVEKAGPGDEVAMKTDKPVHEKDALARAD